MRNKKHHNYKFQPASSQRQESEELATIILSFVRSVNLTTHDWVVLDIMIRQLSNKKAKFPRKVFRAMQTKFERIRDSYQK